MFDGFMSRWMIPFLMRVLDRVADLHEQLEALFARVETLAWSQYSVIGMPLTSSITKYGRPLSVAPASSTLAIFGVVHERQRLSLRLESRDHLAGVHACLDDLESDHATNRVGLLRLVNDAESALAQFLEDLVAPR